MFKTFLSCLLSVWSLLFLGLFFPCFTGVFLVFHGLWRGLAELVEMAGLTMPHGWLVGVLLGSLAEQGGWGA